MLTQTRTSDVTLYRRCRKAWYLQEIAKVPRKPKAHLDRGTLGHADVERWLTTEQEPVKPAGRVLVENLRDRGFEPGCSGGQVLAEWSWRLPCYPDGPDFGAVDYTGQADLVVLLPDQQPILIDHKTMADLGRALSPDELRSNVQLGVYSHAIFTLLAPKATEIGVIHNCAETRGKHPIGKLVGATITRAEAAATWDAVARTVEQMARTAEAKTAEDVPGDPTGRACSMYGACPYQSRCSTWARLQRVTPAAPATGGVMSMMDKIKGGAPAATDAAPTTGAPATTATTALPEPDRVERTGPAEDIRTHHQLAVYIDCVPVPCGQGEVFEIVHLEQHLAPLVDEVCRRANVPHYGFIDGWVGKAQVAALLGCNLPQGHVVVDSRLPLSPMCIEALVKHATSLTRGSR